MYNMSVCYRNHLKSGVALHVRKLQFVIVPPCMLGVRRSLSNEFWQPVGCCCIASASKISPAVQFALTRCVLWIGKNVQTRLDRENMEKWTGFQALVIVATLFDVAVYLDMDNAVGFRGITILEDVLFCIQSKQSLFCARKPTGRGANACSLMRHVIGWHFWYANMTSILLGKGLLAAWCALLEIGIEQASNEI